MTLEAMTHLKHGEIDYARQILNSSLKTNPNDSDSWALMTFCSKDPLSCAEKALALHKKSALALIALGLAKHHKKGQRSGIDELNKAIQLEPSTLAFDARGRVLLNTGEIFGNLDEKAIADFSNAIKINPRSVVSYLLRGDAYFNRGNTTPDEQQANIQMAIENYSEALKIDPRCVDAYILRGRAYGWIGNNKCIDDFSKAIEIDPRQNWDMKPSELVLFPDALPYTSETLGVASRVQEAYSQRAAAYWRLKQYDKATADYTRLIKAQPDNIGAYKDRAESYLKLKDYANAIADCTFYLNGLDAAKKRQKISEDVWQKASAPSRVQALSNRAIARAALNQNAEANDDANNAIALIEKYSLFYVHAADPYFIRGEYSLSEKKYETAIADYSKGLQLNPYYAAGVINRASAYFGLRKYKDAAADYTKAIEMGSSGADLYMIRGKCYLETGQFEKALADFNKARQSQPDSPSVLGRFYRNRAELFSKKGEHKKAIDDLSEMLSLDKNNLDGYILRAKEYSKINDYGSVLKDYLSIAILKPIWLCVCLIPIFILLLITFLLKKKTSRLSRLSTPKEP